MKKLGAVVKDVSESRIKKTLKDSESVIIVKYSGLTSPDLSALRMNLKTSRANFFVVKNSVARRALKDSGLESLVKSIEGPCGIVFIKDEPVDASKVLYTFSKEHDKLKLEGGCLGERILDAKDIEALAKMPSKDAMRAKLVMLINSPISRLVRALNSPLQKIAVSLDQIKQKKAGQEGGK